MIWKYARSITIILGAFLTASSARAQRILHSFCDPTPGFGFGFYSFAGAGDLNADGVPDVLVSSPNQAATLTGTVYAYSGKDGTTLHTIVGPYSFGSSIDGLGDIDKDGFDDFLIGADDRVEVRSGRNGALLQTYAEPGTHSSYAGDVNGDGWPDLLIGHPFDSNDGYYWNGLVRVYSGRTATLLRELKGTDNFEQIGAAVSDLGDVDGMGAPDQLVGSYSGLVRVYSGETGAPLYSVVETMTTFFGESLDGGGDINGDGIDDFVAGDAYWNNFTGLAKAFSGVDGAELFTIHGTDTGAEFGNSAAIVGDVNGDGFADVACGTGEHGVPNYLGILKIVSGQSGNTLHQFIGAQHFDHLGVSPDGLGDVDGDGVDDLGFSALLGCQGMSGRAFVISMACPTLGTKYCGPANPNSSGNSGTICAAGSPNVVDNDVVLHAAALAMNEFAMFLNSQTAGFAQPPGSQGNLCLGGGIGRYNQDIMSTGAIGAVSLDLDLANTPTPGGLMSVMPGETWHFQVWFRDANPGPTSNFSDGVAITFL